MRRLLYLFFVSILATGLLTPPAFGQVSISCAGESVDWGSDGYYYYY